MKYYSETLDKNFDTVKELVEAEKAKFEADKAAASEAEQAKQDKKELAHKVEQAYTHWIEVQDKNSDKLAEFHKQIALENKEAENNYRKLRNEFIKKYGSFHMTYKDDVPVVEITDEPEQKSFTDVFNELFKLLHM